MKDIQTIKEELKNLAEDKKTEMSVNVYEYIWQIIQSIDIELEVEND